MGVSLKELIRWEQVTFPELKGKVCVVDTFNLLYQFLTTIRSRDGSMLTDSHGNTTSHLVGLFSRTTKLMEYGIKLAFVFDGEAPALKKEEREHRKDLKLQAEKAFQQAEREQDIDAMKKYASRTARLTPELIAEAKKLIYALGLPVIQAPAEGEAQAAHVAQKGDAYAVISQDYDSLLHGAPRLIRNVSLSGKRKTVNKLSYAPIEPEYIELSQNLNRLGIDQEQLIALALLVGTDYDRGGIKGIGPKKALTLVKQFGKDFDALFKEVQWDSFFNYPWTDAYYTIKKMPLSNSYDLSWKPVEPKSIHELLVDAHDFSPERVDSSIQKLLTRPKSQKGLGEFI